MAFGVKARITGLGETFAKLDGFKRGVRSKIVRKAVDLGTRLVLKQAQTNTPSMTGLARKSLGRKVKVYRSSGVVVGVIGPRKGFKKQVVLALKNRKVKGAIDGTKKAASLIERSEKFVKKTYDPVRYFHFIEGGRGAMKVKNRKVLSSGLEVFGHAVRPAAGRKPLERAWESRRAEVVSIMKATITEAVEALAVGTGG